MGGAAGTGGGSEVIFTCSLTHRLVLLLSRSSTWDLKTYEHNYSLSLIHTFFIMLVKLFISVSHSSNEEKHLM